MTMMRSASTTDFLDVVGDDDQRRPEIGPQLEQMVLQIDAREGIERGERLVEQQHLGPRHQRARDRDALRLAAGELARPAPRLLGQADALKRLGDAFGALRRLGRSARPKPTLSATLSQGSSRGS